MAAVALLPTKRPKGSKQEWETPDALFAALDAEFDFTLDAAATPENAKCRDYLTAECDALAVPWAGRVFLNPPYGTRIGRWVEKAYREAQRGATVVCLLPASTETRWWHAYAMRAQEIRLIRGRLRFSRHTVNAPFSSVVVVFTPGQSEGPRLTAMDRALDPAVEVAK